MTLRLISPARKMLQAFSKTNSAAKARHTWRRLKKVLSFAIAASMSGPTPKYGREHFENVFSRHADPWRYTSLYEQTRYAQTLSLLPQSRIAKALELACAEGHFTVQLAPRVGSLIAADISQVALGRAAERCRHLQNVLFRQVDLTIDPLPEDLDLIVCSQVLYFVNGLKELRQVAHKFAQALKPEGYLLMAHDHQIIDEPEQAGFDYATSFGAKVISDTFARVPSLRLVKEIWTPLYRVQLFQRCPCAAQPGLRHAPEIIRFSQQPVPLPREVEAYAHPKAGSICRLAISFGQHLAPRLWNAVVLNILRFPALWKVLLRQTYALPIIAFHRVAPTGAPATAAFRLTPEGFEERLRYLRKAGFHSVTLSDWQAAMEARRPLPGRAIALTFDDGYHDFYEYAYPLLKKYGFSATVFLVAQLIGSSNVWDAAYGEEVPLMDWPEIRQLRDEGVIFGSHSASHRLLTSLDVEEIRHEGLQSRTLLEQGLGVPVIAFAYPYGDFDATVEQVIQNCGYTLGLSCQAGLSGFQERPLALPRIEVQGEEGLEGFIAKLIKLFTKNLLASLKFNH